MELWLFLVLLCVFFCVLPLNRVGVNINNQPIFAMFWGGIMAVFGALECFFCVLPEVKFFRPAPKSMKLVVI